MNSLKYLYDIQPKIKVKINNADIEGFFFDEKINDIRNKQNTLYFYTTSVISIGSIARFNNKSYLVMGSENDYNGVYYVYFLEEINYIIKSGTDTSSLSLIEGILQTDAFNLSQQTDALATSSNRFSFICQNNEITYSINYDTKVVALRNFYQITGIDTSNRGLIVLTCEKIAKSDGYDYSEVFEIPISPTDPTEPEEPIDPEPPEPTHNYSITIAGNNRPYKSQINTYTATIKDGDVVVTDKSVLWSIDNASYTFTEQLATTCKVKAPSTAPVKANLRATLSDDALIFVDYALETRNL